MTASPWCVKHRRGWCAVADGERPDEGVANVPTACRHVVVLPGGIARRQPDCPGCVTALAKGRTT